MSSRHAGAIGNGRKTATSGTRRRNPPTKEYRLWSLAWIGFLLIAFGIGVFTFFYHSVLSSVLLISLVVFANILVVAAIMIDSVKLRRLREDYGKQVAASAKTKAARAEQKKLKAAERERAKAQSEHAPASELREEDMSFRERIAYRARKSAEAANVKGSGL